MCTGILFKCLHRQILIILVLTDRFFLFTDILKQFGQKIRNRLLCLTVRKTSKKRIVFLVRLKWIFCLMAYQLMSVI